MKHILVGCAALLLAACGGGSPVKSAKQEELARLNVQMGIDYFSKGDYDLAQEKLQKAVEQAPDLQVAHSSLALVYGRVGKAVQAEKEYNKALSLGTDNGEVENNFGVFLCGLGRTADAEKHFLAAVEDKKYTTPAAAYNNAGVCLRASNPEKAERYFRVALDTNSEFADALFNMAQVTFDKKDYWRTRAFLQRYEILATAGAETLWLRARTERALGDNLAARQYEARIRNEFPTSDAASKIPPQ